MSGNLHVMCLLLGSNQQLGPVDPVNQSTSKSINQSIHESIKQASTTGLRNVCKRMMRMRRKQVIAGEQPGKQARM